MFSRLSFTTQAQSTEFGLIVCCITSLKLTETNAQGAQLNDVTHDTCKITSKVKIHNQYLHPCTT